MARRAGIKLMILNSRHLARGDARLTLAGPMICGPSFESDGKPGVGSAFRRRTNSPRRVGAPRPVACFTANVDLDGSRVESIPRIIERLHKCRRMTRGALAIPVHGATLPMKRIPRWNLFVAVNREPSLAPDLLGSGIPRNGPGLKSAARLRNKQLLKRRHAECRLDTTSLSRSIARRMRHNKGIPFAMEAPLVAAEGGLHILEIPEDTARRRHHHGEVMMRAGPCLRSIRMAFRTSLSTDERGFSRRNILDRFRFAGDFERRRIITVGALAAQRAESKE